MVPAPLMQYIQLFLSTPGWQNYIAAIILKTVSDWLVLWVFNRIVRMQSSGAATMAIVAADLTMESMLLLWFCGRIFSKIVTEKYYTRVKNKFDKDLLLTFQDQAMEAYEALNFPTRKIETLATYLPRLRHAKGFLRSISGVGMHAFLGLGRALFDIYIALGDVRPLRYTVAATLIGTFYLLSLRAEELNVLQRHRRDQEENVTNRVKMEEPYFEMGKKDRDALMKLHKDFSDLSEPVLEIQQQYTAVLSFGEELIVSAVMLSHFHFDAVGVNIINILRSIINMHQSFNHCSKFHRNYVEDESNMTKYLDFWKRNECNKIDPANKLPWPSQLTCLDINFVRTDPSYTLRLNEAFVLPQGSKILLRGETGAGKSTFCELLQGRDVVSDVDPPAMIFEEGNQRCFAHYIAECSQDMSSMLKWDTSTIRDHFDSDADSELIVSFCRLAHIYDKVRMLGLDNRINKRLSGGEKQRITLAANLHYNYKMKVKFMIFDEPERGLGESAPSIISDILKCGEYAETTILISSHHTNLDVQVFSHLIDISKSGNIAIANVTKLKEEAKSY